MAMKMTFNYTKKPNVSTTHAKFGKALHTNYSNWLQLDGSIDVGGQDFTVDFWCFVSSEKGVYPAPFCFFLDEWTVDKSNITFFIFHNSTKLAKIYVNTNSKNCTQDFRNALHHFAWVYQHDTTLSTLYVDGVKNTTLTVSINRMARYLKIANNNNAALGCYSGYIDEFRFSDGIARWTENFTPPTAPYKVDSYTKVLLHFDDENNPFKDDCGNIWATKLLIKI